MTNYADYITVNPKVCHGQACFSGTRILVYLVLEMLEDGETPKEIIKKRLPSAYQGAYPSGSSLRCRSD